MSDDRVTYETHAVAGWHPVYRHMPDHPPMGGYKIAQFKTERVANEVCDALNNAFDRGEVHGIDSMLSLLATYLAENFEDAEMAETIVNDLRHQVTPKQAEIGSVLR